MVPCSLLVVLPVLPSAHDGSGCDEANGERDGGAEFRAAIVFRLRDLAKIAQANVSRAV